MNYLTLDEYLTGAKKIILAQQCGYLLYDEDAVSHVAYRMMLADQTWNGSSSRETWRYNQAKYAIMRIITKRKQERGRGIQSLDYGWDLENDRRSHMVPCKKINESIDHQKNVEQFEDVCERAETILSERQLDCFKLYYKENLSMEEVGQQLGMSKQAVSLHVIRGTKELRRCMSKQD